MNLSYVGNEQATSFFFQSIVVYYVSKVKGKTVLVLNEALRHEEVWGSGCIFLTSEIVSGEWSASRHCRFHLTTL
jgi:hypothetical protein